VFVRRVRDDGCAAAAELIFFAAREKHADAAVHEAHVFDIERDEIAGAIAAGEVRVRSTAPTHANPFCKRLWRLAGSHSPNAPKPALGPRELVQSAAKSPLPH
jgi:hypothetical protein